MGTERIRKEKKPLEVGVLKVQEAGEIGGKCIQCLRVGSRKGLKGGSQDGKGQEKRMQSTDRGRF